MSAQLKPCPFCGSDDIEIRQPIQDSWMFHCHQCHAAVQFLTCDCWGSTNHAAVLAWNRRAEVKPDADAD